MHDFWIFGTHRTLIDGFRYTKILLKIGELWERFQKILFYKYHNAGNQDLCFLEQSLKRHAPQNDEVPFQNLGNIPNLVHRIEIFQKTLNGKLVI